MSFILLIVSRVILRILDLKVSFHSINYIFILVKVKKNTLETIYILVLASKKVFKIKQIFVSIFSN